MRKECVMAGKENIEPYKYDAEKARVAGKVGGVKSGEAKRKKKLLRELLNELLERQNNLVIDENGDPMTNAAIMAVKAIDAASGGDWKAWELVRDTAGQKPVDRVKMQTDVNIADSAERLSNIFEQIKEEK
jgi:hypothetical protein